MPLLSLKSTPLNPCATQHGLQAMLDQHQNDNLFTAANIRNQACLSPILTYVVLAVGAWLKTILQSYLGLALLGPEFVVFFRLWLGIPLFSIFIMCVPYYY